MRESSAVSAIIPPPCLLSSSSKSREDATTPIGKDTVQEESTVLATNLLPPSPSGLSGGEGKHVESPHGEHILASDSPRLKPSLSGSLEKDTTIPPSKDAIPEGSLVLGIDSLLQSQSSLSESPEENAVVVVSNTIREECVVLATNSFPYPPSSSSEDPADVKTSGSNDTVRQGPVVLTTNSLPRSPCGSSGSQGEVKTEVSDDITQKESAALILNSLPRLRSILSGSQGDLESPVSEDEKDETSSPLDEKHTAAILRDDWDSDPINARNWSSAKKWWTVFLVSSYTFIAPLGSSAMAPALPDIARHYNISSPTLTSMTLCIFLLSFAFGPLFFAPLSEMYGRTWVLHTGNLFFLALNLGCAFSRTANVLIGFRFLSGFAGSASIACGGGSVSDLFAPHERASAMALYSIGPLLGPAIGPVMGGFISQNVGFKYIFILLACICALVALIAIPTLRETYAPVIHRRRAALRQGDLEKADSPGDQISRLQYLWLNLTRPVILLTRSLICFMLSLYMSFMYGSYYLLFATFPEVYGSIYGFGAAVGGLAYIATGIGFFSSTLVGARLGDYIYKKLSQQNGGVGKPEFRIPALIFGSFFVPAGFLWYGWSAWAHLHWIMPMIGTAIFGFGLMMVFLPILLYLVDAFTFAASAVAAASVFRSLLGFVFPLFGEQLYVALGIGGGNSLLAGLSILLGVPFPIWLWYHGERMRARSPLTASPSS